MKTKRILMMAVAAVMLFVACVKDEEYTTPTIPALKNNSENGITLGAKLENAYSVENMNRALHRLADDDNTGCFVYDSLYPTHLYVKAIPQDTSETSQILDDTNIAAFPYPLDYELIGSGEYQPANLEDTGAVYMVVPIDYDFGTLYYETIDECVIPEDDDDYMEEIERVSLILTGNLDEPIKIDNSKKSSRKASGRPSGYIRVYNTTTSQYEGVRNIKVTMNTLVRVRTAWTDTTGHYSTGTKFWMNVNYTISFTNRQGYIIWPSVANILPTTMGLGVHSPGGYSYNMNTNSYGWFYSTINNATSIYTQWLCSSMGISRPPNGMRIAAVQSSSFGTGSTPLFRIRNTTTMLNDYCAIFSLRAFYAFFILPDIIIAKNSGSTYSTYRTVFHELAHASHYQRVDNLFWLNLMAGEVLLAFSNGYGSPSSINAGYIGVSEGWAYYADFKISNRYWNSFSSLNTGDMQDHNHVQNRNEWFRPGLFDTLDTHVYSWGTQSFYNSLNTDINNMCNLKLAIIDDLSWQYQHYADSLLQPICSTMFTEDPTK